MDAVAGKDNLVVVPDELGNVFGDLLHPFGRDNRLQAVGRQLNRPEAARLKLREQRHE